MHSQFPLHCCKPTPTASLSSRHFNTTTSASHRRRHLADLQLIRNFENRLQCRRSTPWAPTLQSQSRLPLTVPPERSRFHFGTWSRASWKIMYVYNFQPTQLPGITIHSALDVTCPYLLDWPEKKNIEARKEIFGQLLMFLSIRSEPFFTFPPIREP